MSRTSRPAFTEEGMHLPRLGRTKARRGRRKIPDEHVEDTRKPANPTRTDSNLEALSHEQPRKRGASINATVDDVLRVVHNYEEYSSPSDAAGVVLRDLPNLDDVTQYDVSAEAQKRLWRHEVERLVGVMNDFKKPLEFIGTEVLAHDSKGAYETLTMLADQMWLAWNIISHDSESILFEKERDMYMKHVLERSRQDLLYFTGQDDKEPVTGTSSNATQEDYFRLVDYATSVMAKILCMSAHGAFWHNNTLAILAKLSAKFKVLSARPKEFAERSLDMGAVDSEMQVLGAADSYKRFGRSKDMQDPRDDLDGAMAALHSSFQPRQPGLEPWTGEEAVRATYWITNEGFRRMLLMLLRYLLLSLRGVHRYAATSTTSYEVSAMVYETGFERFRTFLFQGRDESCTGTSDPDAINLAHAAFELLNHTLEHLDGVKQKAKGHGTPPPISPQSLVGPSEERSLRTTAAGASSSNDSGSSSLQANLTGATTTAESVGTEVSWSYIKEGDRVATSEQDAARDNGVERRLRLQSMNEVITIMVQLYMASPNSIDDLADALTMLLFTQNDIDHSTNPIVPYMPEKFKALVCLSTREYSSNSTNRSGYSVSSLSKVLETRDRSFSLGEDTDTSCARSTLGEKLLPQAETDHVKKVNQKGRYDDLEEAAKIMSEWVLEEKGVLVKCGLYVWTVIAVCTLLAAGGIAIGVTVHNRVPAVDPFNITTYCWVVSAFVLIVARSVRVGQWSWRDFLLRRVLCRSVSELRTVTGVHEQLILAKLLHDESTTPLQTRGPYNCVFDRKADDGFSIDTPLSLWTMLLSGLIPMQVQSPRGAGLVCLDVRRGTKLNWISKVNLPRRKKEDEKEFICCNRLLDQDSQAGGSKRIVLKRGQMYWHRVTGVYAHPESVFV